MFSELAALSESAGRPEVASMGLAGGRRGCTSVAEAGSVPGVLYRPRKPEPKLKANMGSEGAAFAGDGVILGCDGGASKRRV